MTIARAIALLERALAGIATLLGLAPILQLLGVKVENLAIETRAYYIQNRLDQLFSHVDSSIAGFPWVHSAITQAVTDINGHTDAALDGLTVNWPSEAPSWYTAPTVGPDEDTIAAAVWAWASSQDRLDGFRTGLGYGELLQGIWAIANWEQGFWGVPLAENPYVGACTDVPDVLSDGGRQWTNYSAFGHPPVPDWSQWLSSDTVYSFLNRTQPTVGWTNVGPNGLTSNHRAWVMGSYHGVNRPYYCSRFTELEAAVLASSVDLSPITDKLDSIQPSNSYNLSTLTADVGGVEANATTILADLLALTGDGEITLQMIIDLLDALTNLVPKVVPVWPGSDNVTLGESVALTSQLHLTGDMDGVIVAITTPPTRTGLYEVGGAPLDYGQGRITFETDSGDLEPWQYLGFRTAIYTPKSMAHASGVRFQMLAGAAGTVTPWTMGA